jgi:hypothetical protein
MVEKCSAKRLLDDKFRGRKFPSTQLHRLYCKAFPDEGHLVIIKVEYVDELIAQCTLVQYVDITGFATLKDEMDTLLGMRDRLTVAWVKRSNPRTSHLPFFLC